MGEIREYLAPNRKKFCLTNQSFKFMVRSRGIEPRLRDPQSRVLSVER